MKKLYAFLSALVLSVSAFAQSSLSDFYGDWTFTFLDNNDGGKQVSMVLNLKYESSLGENVFVMPEGKGLIYLAGGSVSGDVLSLNFRPWGYSYMTVDGYKTDQSVYAYYNGDNMTTNNAWLDYNIADKTISNLEFNYGSLGKRSTTSIGFNGSYSGAENGTFDYTLVSMKYGTEDEGGNNSISVSIPTSMAYPSSLTEAQIFAMVEANASGFDEYDVYYNLYLDNTPIVPDTKIIPDGGEYLIYVQDLSFEMTYTLNVWATSGDYKSPVATDYIYTGYSPDIRLSAKADNISATSADITVTTNYWDIEYGPVIFTITAESENGPEVDPITIEDKGSGTFSITGLSGNTQYTYKLSYSAYDQVGGVYEKANAASVTFTTLAPTIELEGINYSPVSQGAAFVVNTVNAQGVPADRTVDVYFQLEGSEDTPAKADLVNGTYRYTFSGLEAEKEYTAVIFGGIGTYGETGFVKGTEYTEKFTTGAAEPQITITFPEGSYSSSIQSRYYAQITATPDIVAENAPEYDVYYNLYMGATKYRDAVKVEPTDGEYIINIGELNFSRQYKVEVYATVGDGAYTSETASFEITTVDEPGLNIIKAEAQNISETSAELVVEYGVVSLPEDVNFKVSVAAQDAPEVEAVTTTDTQVTFNLTGLTPGTLYTYHVTVTADAAGTLYQANRSVIVETLEPSQSITLDQISYNQVESGATFTVAVLNAEGFDDDTEFDIYFQLDGSDATPEKAVLVKNGDEQFYVYTFSNLTPKTPYTAIIFGGTGEYGTDSFFQGTVYKKNFVSGEQSGVMYIVTDNDDNARYFNLQGVEIDRPVSGTICIKVEGNKATKVIVK